jgi:DNA-binding response OmpR family regulator/two-component sensor histidine kinase
MALEHSKAIHLQEIDEIKNRFFSNITHEFRTPLTLILTPLERLSKEVSLSTVHRQTVMNANKNAEQLLQLINQLLDISKIESGQMKINLSTGELDEFTERCVQRFAEQARGKNISLRFSAIDAKGNYQFDEDKWGKIIFNLLSNALKFTQPGGRIIVSLQKRTDPFFILTVNDTGIGIPEDKLLKIFDRFYMADDRGTRTQSGSGIGLALVKELTELMKGTIEVKSSPGDGTAFTVTVPLEKAGRAAEKLKKEILIPSLINEAGIINEEIAGGPLVLVAEDNDDLRSFLVQCLSPKWKVLEAADGRTAWQLMLKELPEIVISDMMMPGMDGIELCKLAKNDSRTAHISFIMLTAKAAHQSRVSGLEAGADEYITKPFHFDELELRINNLLKQQETWRKRLQQQLLPGQPSHQLPHVNDLFLQKLYQYLDERLDEPGLDVESIAGVMTMSRRTLNRKLKALLNISPNDFIKRYRLQKAAALISSGHAVAETAYTVGFETPSYFTQCFKEQYGQTPTEFAAQKTV